MAALSPVGPEPDPTSLGVDAARLGAAVDLFEHIGGPARLRVLRHGRILVDRAIGCSPRALFWPFSVSKIWLAVLVHRLAERGIVDLDAPVAAYWPAFAARGKAAITVRDVLQHRSGLPRVGGTLAEVSAMTDWRRATQRLAAATPDRTRDRRPAYEWLAFGFILGEVVERSTGMRLQAALAENVLAPLGLRNTFAQTPRVLRSREVPFRGVGPTTMVVARVLNREAVRAAVIPAGGIQTTAHDLSVVLESLLGSLLGRRPAPPAGSSPGPAPGDSAPSESPAGDAIGHSSGEASAPPRILAAGSVAALIAPSNHGEFDRYAGGFARWGNGLQLGGPGRTRMRASAFGQRSSPRAFGHNGSNSSVAWADPDRDLVVVHLTGVIRPFPRNRFLMMAAEDALIGAVDAGQPAPDLVDGP